MLVTDGRDLVARFRELAPPRPPIRVQKWSPRRVGLLAGTVVATLLGALVLTSTVLGTDPSDVRAPACPASVPVQLFGQAVQRSAYVPCVPRTYAEGTGAASTEVDDRGGRTVAQLPEGGTVSVTFTVQCLSPRGAELPSAGLPLAVEAWEAGTGRVLLTVPGGCVELAYPVDTLGRARLALPRLRDVVRLVPRWRLDLYVARLTDGQERHL
jgi:hypothetical protein